MDDLLKNKYVRYMLFVVVFAAFIYSLVYLSKTAASVLNFLLVIFAPIIIAPFIIWTTKPLTSFIVKNFGVPKSFAVLVSIVILNLLIFLISFFIISKVINEIIDLQVMLPYYFSNLNIDISSIIERIQNFYLGLPSPILKVVQMNLEKIYQFMNSKIIDILGILKVIPVLVEILIVWFIGCISAFVLENYDIKVGKIISSNLPKNWVDEFRCIRIQVINAVMGFLKAQFILMGIMALTSFLFLLIIGGNYIFIMSILLGVVSIIPVVGHGLILIPWIIYEFVVYNYTFAVKLIVVYFLLLMIRELVIIKVVSDNVGLNFLTTLLSIYAGVKIFGAFGFILGPLMVIVLKEIWNSTLCKGFREDLTKLREGF